MVRLLGGYMMEKEKEVNVLIGLNLRELGSILNALNNMLGNYEIHYTREGKSRDKIIELKDKIKELYFKYRK